MKLHLFILFSAMFEWILFNARSVQIRRDEPREREITSGCELKFRWLYIIARDAEVFCQNIPSICRFHDTHEHAIWTVHGHRVHKYHLQKKVSLKLLVEAIARPFFPFCDVIFLLCFMVIIAMFSPDNFVENYFLSHFHRNKNHTQKAFLLYSTLDCYNRWSRWKITLTRKPDFF